MIVDHFPRLFRKSLLFFSCASFDSASTPSGLCVLTHHVLRSKFKKGMQSQSPAFAVGGGGGGLFDMWSITKRQSAPCFSNAPETLST